MKKLVLTGLLVLSTMTFAAKITTTGKSWEKIEKEYRVPEVKEESILVFNWSDENNDTYHFRIIKSDLKKNNDFYLMEFYEDKKPENGLPLVSDPNNASNLSGYTLKESFFGDSGSEYFVSYYKIRKTTVKGIYYITNYVDLNGKKYSKLYFGFDEKHKKIVITVAMIGCLVFYAKINNDSGSNSKNYNTKDDTYYMKELEREVNRQLNDPETRRQLEEEANREIEKAKREICIANRTSSYQCLFCQCEQRQSSHGTFYEKTKATNYKVIRKERWNKRRRDY